MLRIGHYELETPLMNAGGLVKTPSDTEAMAVSGVGAIVAGSFTEEARSGNNPDGTEVVYHHDTETGITTNALGMPNVGITALATNGDLQTMIDITHETDKPFVLNIAPVSSEPALEIIRMCGVLYEAGIRGIDAIELNASCPNIPTGDGGRKAILSHHPDQLFDVLSELSDARGDGIFKDLFVRISPFIHKDDAVLLVRSVIDADVDAVVAFNTFPGGQPVRSMIDTETGGTTNIPILTMKNGVNGIGGQSGIGMSPLAEQHMQWLVEAREMVSDNPREWFDIIGSNGIGNAETMHRRLEMGASAVSATTIFWEEKAGVVTTRVLDEYSQLQ